ncbi:phage major capsid protein [Halobacillus sp. A5]|uniref:phage major capsid protein n=1 Tax=Halobacillus sp. A5 TaxID=2880263 RepID=UPI0020A6247C|nr:phage major capsid protein [Halobacillus sp. A5]MCP3025410.1 phage major capsid protein [Halobacillus sp. A5]
MALKQLMLNKKISQRKSLLEELNQTTEEFNTRSAELEQAIEEAESDEEVSTVEEEVNQLDSDKEKNETKKQDLETEIADLEAELEQLNENEPKRSMNTELETRTHQTIEGAGNMKVNKYESRSQMMERLNQPEVREFYGKLKEAVQNKRSLSGSDLVIPEQVMDRIKPMIGDYSSLYNEVEVINLSGTGRAILDGAIPKGIWTEASGALEELSLAFDSVELDGYKVGGFVPVDNHIVEDSMIDLANYVEDRIARAIGKAIDDAILNGGGSTDKQPEGIIPAVEDDAVTSDFTFSDLLPNLAVVDNGEDNVGEIIAVMKRATYYKHFLPQTVATTDDGRQVVQGVNNPNLAGVRVVFDQYTPDDAVVFGDFKQYMLGERRGVQLASSSEARFVEDQTVFKGTARYDGKPAKNEAFVLVNYDDGSSA